LRSHGLVRHRQRKHQTKRCLRAVKAQWRLFKLLVAADTQESAGDPGVLATNAAFGVATISVHGV